MLSLFGRPGTLSARISHFVLINDGLLFRDFFIILRSEFECCMEKQNIEYKESWRDEYLKWICGFANAQGGTLYIGMNDKGEVVGVDNAKRLLEDIPNKVSKHIGHSC